MFPHRTISKISTQSVKLLLSRGMKYAASVLLIFHENEMQYYEYVYTFLGYTLGQLVTTLRYKPERRGFDSRWGYLDFLWQSIRQYYGCGIYLASSSNEYQGCPLGSKDDHCLRLTTFPPSCAVCLEILGDLTACPVLCMDCFTCLYTLESVIKM